MAVTRGFVQRLKVTDTSIPAWVYIGPSPADTELFIVQFRAGISSGEIAAGGAMIDALGAALTSGREVQVTHPDGSADITSVQLPPP
jgi:hypothetical protein